MSQEVATQERPKSFRQQIEEFKPELSKTLPVHIKVDAYVRIVQTAVQLNPDLTQCTPRSLLAACMKAATDGLILDGREAALVVRNVKVSKKNEPDKWEKQATYQPMVQGLIKLARNSGQISSIIAHVVYKNDKFHYVLGDDERIEHEPASFDMDQGEPIAAYAIVKLTDGTTIREVMRKTAIINIAGQGTNAYQYDPERGKNFAEWWRKTVLRRITKYIPRSSDAIGKFTDAVETIDHDFEFADDAAPQQAAQPARKTKGAAAAALKDITPAAKPVQQEQPQEDHDPETGEIIDGDDFQEGDVI